jgi:hypothetical protein
MEMLREDGNEIVAAAEHHAASNIDVQWSPQRLGRMSQRRNYG